MMYLLLLLIIILLVVFTFFSIGLFNIVFRGYAPYISTRKEVLDAIGPHLKLSENFRGKIYELGCGQAGFLHLMEKKYPNAEFVGVEYSLIPYISARMQIAIQGSKIKILKKNLFRVDVSEADVIYCYLNAKMMMDLEKKLKFECKPLAKIISYLFPLPHFTPEKTIDLDTARKALAKQKALDIKKKEDALRKKGKKIKPKKERKHKDEIPNNLFFYEI